MRSPEGPPTTFGRGAVRPREPVAFVDGEHVPWQITERDARRDPGARRDRCLLFACADAVRRVWNYPPDWRVLPAEALVALSWQR